MTTGRGFSFTRILRNTKKQNKSIVKSFKQFVKIMSKIDKFITRSITKITKTNVIKAKIEISKVVNIDDKNVIDFHSYKLKKTNSIRK